MLEYIYFVKCPGCEDEHFHFFNEAKDFAMSCMSQKPIITQVEVNRNDFGECTDSCDLGTVWSWEDLMTDDEPAKCIFTKDDLKCCDVDRDPEFASLDNSLDSVPDNFRKPVPANMAIEDLVEEMEENEDTVECKWCDELFDKSECRYEVDLGWLCDRCQAAIKSRGETLTFREDPVDEAWERDPFDHHDPDYDEDEAADALADLIDGAKDDMYDRALQDLDEAATPSDKEVDFEYNDLKVTLLGQQRDVDDWDEEELVVDFTYTKTKDDVANDIWENFITEEDAADVEGGLTTLEDEAEWEKFLETHFDTLFEKYYDKLLDFYRPAAAEAYEERSLEDYYDELAASKDDNAYDEYQDNKHFLDESVEPRDLVELEYPRLTVTLYGPKRDADTWDEVEHTDSHVFLVPKVEVATAIWENWITEEDVKDVEGGLETLEDDKTWEAFLETHFDDLFEKYNKQILEYFKKEATEDFRERAQEDSDLTRWANNSKPKSYLEELEESADYRARLSDCPECGFKESYDPETGICINCGFTI